MQWIWGALFAGIALFLGMLIEAKKDIKKRNGGEAAETETDATAPANFKEQYQAKYLLTRNEWHEYKKLRQYADKLGFQVCPKVRLLDIIEPRKGENYRSLMARVQSKHVDFLICDQDLHIKAVLELDDNSHEQPDRKRRDAFVDEILTSVGYKVIHTKSVTEDTLEPITPKTTPQP